MAELEKLTATAVRMMDNAIDVSRFPLDEQRAEAFAKRRIGLGVTALVATVWTLLPVALPLCS